MTHRPSATPRTEGLRCISRVVIVEPKTTRGWQVRVVRRGIAIHEFFSDKKFGGKAGALSEAMHFRDRVTRDLRPIPRSELARRVTARNTSGIPGVRRRIDVKKKGDKVFEYPVWEASGSPEPGRRVSRKFSINTLGEDDAREAAIAQRLRWEKQMARNERKAPPMTS